MCDNNPASPKPALWDQRIHSALQQMAKALAYAEDLEQSAWDFAVEIHSLALCPNDLRWLVAKGYVEHAQETTPRDADRRSFRPGGKTIFTSRSCFILSEAGLSLLRVADGSVHNNGGLAGGGNGFGPQVAGPEGAAAVALQVPRWDCNRRELWVGPELVKQFRQRSTNQEKILTAFEEEGWPTSIDDPLPPRPEQEPKRRLHDTIRSLNRRQKHRLVRFVGDGTGQRIIWECIGPRSS